MDPWVQKSIFDQKIESSIFRPKFAQKYYLEVSNQFLVKNFKTQFLDQKWTLEVKNQFLVKKSKVQIFDQIWSKMFRGGLKSIFGRKIKNSNFRPKMDSGGQNRFLIKKSKVQFFDQNWPKNII